MKKPFISLFLVFAMLLSACSMQVTKESAEKNEGEVLIEKTEGLPANRKVNEIELYVTTPEYDPIRYELGLMVTEEWKKLGFDVKVTPLEWNRLSELGMQQKNFDAFTLSWAGRSERIDPDHFVYSTLHSSQAIEGAYNIPGYNNPEFDKLAEEQRSISDLEERKKVVHEAEKLFMEDLPYAPIVHRDQVMPYNKTNFTNVKYMLGEGLNSFWTFMEINPVGERKEVRWAYPSDIASLNPLNSTNSHDFQVTRLMYDRLVRIGEDGAPKNWAAEEIVDVNKDGMTYEVSIRKDMKFHDGVPVTAEDVKFSFDFVKEIKSPYFFGMVEPIDSVELVDDYKVRFNLKESFAPFVSNTLAQMYIFPKHFWQPIFEKGGATAVLEYPNDQIVGSGPFKLDYWTRDQEMKMTAVKDYFSPAKVDGILSIPYANTQSMVAAIDKGEADLAGWWIEPIQIEKLEKNPDVEIVNVPDHGFYHINYNMRRKPFDDKAVRLALSYVIPKQRILDEILEGYGTMAHSFVGPANEFWYNEGVQGFNYDAGKAVELLKEQGYQWDENGKIYYPE